MKQCSRWAVNPTKLIQIRTLRTLVLDQSLLVRRAPAWCAKLVMKAILWQGLCRTFVLQLVVCVGKTTRTSPSHLRTLRTYVVAMKRLMPVLRLHNQLHYRLPLVLLLMSRDYRNSAEFVVGSYTGAHSSPVNPPTASLMQPPQQTNASSLPVEEDVDRYYQSLEQPYEQLSVNAEPAHDARIND
jgi:hypothetical protein